MTNPPCTLCQTQRGIYSWDRVCCRTRFILSLKSDESRTAWLGLWSMREGTMCEAVKAELKYRLTQAGISG